MRAAKNEEMQLAIDFGAFHQLCRSLSCVNGFKNLFFSVTMNLNRLINNINPFEVNMTN